MEAEGEKKWKDHLLSSEEPSKVKRNKTHIAGIHCPTWHRASGISSQAYLLNPALTQRKKILK